MTRVFGPLIHVESIQLEHFYYLDQNHSFLRKIRSYEGLYVV